MRARATRARSRRRGPCRGSRGCRRCSGPRRGRPSPPAPSAARGRGGTRAGGRPSASARCPRPRPPPTRRRPPTGRAASPRTRACRPRARAGPARRAWARAWRPRSRRAPGRRAARRASRSVRAPRERRAHALEALGVPVAEPGQARVRQRVEVAREVRAPVAEAHHSDRDGHAGGPRAAGLHHGGHLLARSAPGPSAAPGSCARARRWRAAPRSAYARIGACRCAGVR